MCECERERPQNLGTLKIEICVLFRAPLFIAKRCGVTTYFLYKKIRKTKYKKYMTKLYHSHLLNKKKHV